MKLHNLLPPYGKKHKVKRVGRGDSSGMGNTSGRGNPGEKSRSGRVHYLGFEGGQMPLYRRLPKRGFTPLAKERYQEVNLYSLNIFKENEEITPEILHKKGLIKKADGHIKILGKGALEKPLIVKAHKFSLKAKDEIAKKGGQAVELLISQQAKNIPEKINLKKEAVKVKRETGAEGKKEEIGTGKPVKKEEKTEKKSKAVKDKAKTKNKKEK